MAHVSNSDLPETKTNITVKKIGCNITTIRLENVPMEPHTILKPNRAT